MQCAGSSSGGITKIKAEKDKSNGKAPMVAKMKAEKEMYPPGPFLCADKRDEEMLRGGWFFHQEGKYYGGHLVEVTKHSEGMASIHDFNRRERLGLSPFQSLEYPKMLAGKDWRVIALGREELPEWAMKIPMRNCESMMLTKDAPKSALQPKVIRADHKELDAFFGRAHLLGP